ncbi:MAG: nitroreductase/quinone reductase family protein, partial [Acidimicrobiia bacterium]
EEHTVPLLYLRVGDCLLVIASYGGRDRHPEWYLNLLLEPEVTARVGDRTVALTARPASPAERDVWWPKVVAAYSDYAVYQQRTAREIPVVALEPLGLGPHSVRR